MCAGAGRNTIGVRATRLALTIIDRRTNDSVTLETLLARAGVLAGTFISAIGVGGAGGGRLLAAIDGVARLHTVTFIVCLATTFCFSRALVKTAGLFVAFQLAVQARVNFSASFTVAGKALVATAFATADGVVASAVL